MTSGPPRAPDALVAAASEGDLATVKRLVEGGADLDEPNVRGWTALNIAIHMSHHPSAVKVALYLISAGADYAVAGPDGWRPLVRAAAYSGRGTEILESLFARGDRWRGADDWRGINYAASWRGGGGIRVLVRNGADPDTRDDESRTPLMRAAKRGHRATVQALLETGADPNVKDPAGMSPLMYAARTSVVDNVRALLAAGSNPRLRDAGGRTALAHAREAGRKGVVAFLESR